VLAEIKVGDSIAVNGVCLTVTSFGEDLFSADVMPETFQRTNLSKARVGTRVNLERPLRFSDRLDGHIVSGHVDAVGTIQSVTKLDNANILRINIPQDLLRYVVPQGSVAVDGISLTVVECGDDWFTVSLIPHTWRVTGFSTKDLGDGVNIETDIIGKYVERLMEKGATCQQKGGKINEAFLAEHGFKG